MIEFNPTILIVAWNVNGLNTPFDYHTGEEVKPNYMLPFRNHFKGKDTYLKLKE